MKESKVSVSGEIVTRARLFVRYYHTYQTEIPLALALPTPRERPSPSKSNPASDLWCPVSVVVE